MIEMICISCPMGCHLKVDENNDYSVTGNSCPRGAAYGYEEATAPTRMVTSTVRIFFDKPVDLSLPAALNNPSDAHPDFPLVTYFQNRPDKIEARLPVKTSAPVPKAKIMEVMEAINAVTVNAPVHVGDIIIRNVAETGSDLVSTRSMNVC